MDFADNMSKVASRLTEKYGSTVVMVKKSSNTYNPDSGKYEGSLVEKITIKGYISTLDINDSSGLFIEQGDISLLIPKITFASVSVGWFAWYFNQQEFVLGGDTLNDVTVEYGGKIWRAVDAQMITTQDETITIQFQLRV